MSSNPNAIASIAVEITGDFSPLTDDISSAVSAAQQGGEAIASAFDVQVGGELEDSLTGMGTAADAAGEQMSLFGDDLAAVPFDAAGSSANDLADALDPLAAASDAAGEAASEAASGFDELATSAGDAGDAGDGAAGGITDAGDAAEEAGENASEAAGGGLTELREELLAIGESLVITEGIKEFGEEALNAADNVTHATIALTALTGSAQQANTTIEALSQLGQQDGLAMPSLLTAATRMQAILGPGADVTTLLGDIANGAAVMGTDITSATTRFDQMATAGTASARTLTSIGLSLQSLSTALNTVDPAADSTAATVAKMFKAMDQTDRITVLTTALGTLQGVAQQTAQATFGGQWTQLANAWEEVMVQAGQVLLPVITDILDLTKTDIIPFLEGVTEAFRALPQPVQDTLAAIGLLVALAAPVAAGLATIALGISSIQTLIPAVTAALGTLSTMFGTTAVSETDEAAAATANGAAHAASVAGIEASTVAEGAAGTAAEALTGTLGGLAGVLSGVLAVGFLAYVAGSAQMEQAMANLKAKGDELHTTLLQHVQDVINAAQTLPQFQSAIDLVNQALENGSITEKQAAADMQTLATRAQQLGVDLTQASFGGTTLAAAIDKVGTSASVAWANTNSLGISISTSASAAQIAAAHTQALAIVHQQLAANVTTAQQALVDITTAFNNGQASAADVQKAVAGLTKAQNALTTSLKPAKQAVDDLTAAMFPLDKEIATVDTRAVEQATALASATAAVNAWAQAHGLAGISVGTDTNATADYSSAVTDAHGNLVPFGETLSAVNTTAGSLAQIFPDLVNDTDTYGTAVSNVATAQQAVTSTGEQVSTMITGLGLLVVQATQNYDNAKAQYDVLVASWQQGNDVGALVAAQYQKMQQAASTLAQYTKALQDAQNGLKGALDSSTTSLTNFLTQAGLLENGLDALNSDALPQTDVGLQAMNSYLSQSIASFSNVTGQTDSWNRSLQQATKSLGSDMASAITSVIDGTSSLGAAMEKLGEQMLDICLNIIIKQALAPVESAIANLFGVASSAGSSLGGAAGGAGSGISSAVSGIMAAVSSVISVISGIVTAIASVISAVEQAHANTLLTRIEENTRYTSGSLNQPGGVIYLMQQDQVNFGWIVTNTGDANAYLDTIANAVSLQLSATTSAGQTPEEATLSSMLTAEQSMLAELQSIYTILQSGITIGSSSNGTIDPTQSGALLSQIASNTAWLADIDSILKSGNLTVSAGTTAGSSSSAGSSTPSGTQEVDITPSGAVGGAILTLSSTMVGVFSSISQQNNALFGTYYPMADIAENILPPMAANLVTMLQLAQAAGPQLTYLANVESLTSGLVRESSTYLASIDKNVLAISSMVSKIAGVAAPAAPSGAGGNAGKSGDGGATGGSGTTTATMAVQINVNGANNPRDTAQQIADHLRSISPQFTVGSK
jgi:hypothetical protein